MYYPQAPKEPSGCAQTFTITRAVLEILFIPLVLIFGAVIGILLAFYALSIHPLLALLVVGGAVAVIIYLAKRESRRAAKDFHIDE
jgi:hypothetical protein